MKDKKTNRAGEDNDSSSEKKRFPGYPDYPGSEDIYRNEDKIDPLDDDDYTGINNFEKEYGRYNEKDFDEDVSGDDLDVPGADLDDDEEEIGSEDEENNYYSLGGDDHNDLEEDRDDW